MCATVLYSGFTGYEKKSKALHVSPLPVFMGNYKSKFLFTSGYRWKLKAIILGFYITLSKDGSYQFL